MPSFSTTIAYVGGARCTALQKSIIGILLACRLIAILLLGALIAILLLILRMMLVLIMIPLTRWPLVPLLETLLRVGAQTSMTSNDLSLNPPLFGLHFLALIVNYKSVIHERLEVGVCIGHKLELETIIQTLKQATLLINIISHLIQSIM